MAQPKRPDLLLLVSHNLHDVTMTNREEAKSNAVRDDLSQGSGGGRDRPAAALLALAACRAARHAATVCHLSSEMFLDAAGGSQNVS